MLSNLSSAQLRGVPDNLVREIYSVVGAFDLGKEELEVTSLDENLWLKLCMVTDEVVPTGGDCLALSGLLSQLTEEYSKCLNCTMYTLY